MGASTIITAKPVSARIAVMISALLLWVLPGSSGPVKASQQEREQPAQFHTPTTAEGERASQLLSEAMEIHVANPTRARELLQQIIRIYEMSWGPLHPETAGRYAVFAYYLWGAEWFDGAEELGRRALVINEWHYGAVSTETAQSLSFLAILAERNDQPVQAETMFRGALTIDTRVNPGSLSAANTAFRLGKLVAAQGRFDEAQPFFDQSLAIREQLEGRSSALAALSLEGVGANLFAQGRYADAQESLLRATRISRDRPNTPPQVFPQVAIALGRVRDALGDVRGADAALEEAVSLTRAASSAGSWYSGEAEVAYGSFKRRQGQPADAVSLLRAGCQFEREMARVSLADQRAVTQCMRESVQALRDWSVAGGGRGGDKPTDLRAEAFSKVQYAELFESGYSLARYGARIEAVARGVGPTVQSYHVAEHQYRHHRALFAASFADPAGVSRRPELIARIEAAYSDMLRHRNEIRLSNPIYWRLQQPEAIELSALQSRQGPNRRLLNENEALVVFMIPEDDDPGVVFAVTKDGFEWARTSFTGAQIAQRVNGLRAQIDPGAYGTPRTQAGLPFDRQAAHELYLGLFGDPNIRDLLATKPNWLIVPSGALVSLPPGLLVTEQPLGGATSDNDPSALRGTRWLLREKTITILPAVANLRTLRQILPNREVLASTQDRLVAFADPDFAGASYGYSVPALAGTSPTERGRPRALRSYYRGDQPLASALRTLGRLQGTAVEAEAVRRGLGAPLTSIHSWDRASETRLRSLQSSGALERAQVLLFASHGLVAGDLGLAQPALALAAPAPHADPALDDGLLTAAEAASLTLNADWVILSACNTASPGAAGAQGLSGLVRGFFSAGARSLLVSHWRVRDDVAAILVPDMLSRLSGATADTKAEALRQASLAILDDASNPEYAHPFAWAPFVLVGETAR